MVRFDGSHTQSAGPDGSRSVGLNVPSSVRLEVPRSLRLDGPYRPSRDPTVIVLLLIVLGAVTASLLGIGPAEGIGDGSGPVFPIVGGGDGERTVELEVSVNETDVTVGDPVRIRVTTPDGRPVSNATVRVDGATYRTDDRGFVVHAFPTPGNHEVRATKPAAGNTRYVGTTATVDVERRTVALSVTANRTSVEAGGAVQVRVTLPDGSPTNATVEVGEDELPTGPDGTAVVRVPAAGTYDVTATKPSNRTVRYDADPVELDVVRRAVDLRVTVAGGPPVVGERVTLRVTRADTGDPVAATVVVDGRQRSTGPEGTLDVDLNEAGTLAVTARADPTPSVRFRPENATVEVRKRTVSLSLSPSSDVVGYGEPVTFVLRRTDTDRRVAGTVDVAGNELSTDRNGTLTVVFLPPGPAPEGVRGAGDGIAHGETVTLLRGSSGDGDRAGPLHETIAGGDGPLVAVGLDPGVVPVRGVRDPSATEWFDPAGREVLLLGPKFVLADVDAPDAVPPGETVTATVTVENRGNEDGATVVTYRIGDRRVRERVAVAAGERTTVELVVTAPGTPGRYAGVVAVDGDRVERTVDVGGNASDGAWIGDRPSREAGAAKRPQLCN
ncbi:hypothetical protein BRD00_02235 [Halobacteriales archaeon QS_8_69_26]|nr:MAG: hypothetical protein BRD00_02235 [Halobacteriales archaeon QS_8_69_26]